MRDVDDGRAPRLDPCQHRKQPFDLVLFERSRRFVQNEDAALPMQRPADRDELALGKRKVGNRAADVGRKIELRQDGAGLFVHTLAIEQRERPEPTDRQIAERDVLGNRQRGHQPQLLRDGDDAGRDRVVRAGEVAHAVRPR